MTERRFHTSARRARALAALRAVLVGVLGAVALYETSLQPGAGLVRGVFGRRPEVTPPAGPAGSLLP